MQRRSAVFTAVNVILAGALAACAVQPTEGLASRGQAITDDDDAYIKPKLEIPDLKVTVPLIDYSEWPALPPGWSAVPNGCGAASDPGCDGFESLEQGCDLVADGICRVEGAVGFTADRSRFLWTCRCEAPPSGA
jgi:hypothetical protein